VQKKKGLFTGKLKVHPGSKKVTVVTERKWKASR